MEQYLYSVWDDHDNVIAKDMTLEVAMTLVQGLFDKYYAEPDVYYGIKRQESK